MPESCDIQTLLDSDPCFEQLSERAQQVVIAVLLCEIASGGGGGGSGGVSQGHGAPVAAPTNPAIPWVYTDLDSGVMWTWNVGTQMWQ